MAKLVGLSVLGWRLLLVEGFVLPCWGPEHFSKMPAPTSLYCWKEAWPSSGLGLVGPIVVEPFLPRARGRVEIGLRA